MLHTGAALLATDPSATAGSELVNAGAALRNAAVRGPDLYESMLYDLDAAPPAAGSAYCYVIMQSAAPSPSNTVNLRQGWQTTYAVNPHSKLQVWLNLL
jgi:hypothetical protein